MWERRSKDSYAFFQAPHKGVLLFYLIIDERIKKMKNQKISLLLLLTIVCVICFNACANTYTNTDALWEDAIYDSDRVFGKGEVRVEVEVKALDKSVTFTVNTDKENLGDALVEHSLIEGDEGPFGLYIKKVNGILADYDVDQSYWSFTKDGEMMMTGVDGTTISDGEHYELTYTK